MKYNFDKVTDRYKTNSLKWNVAKNELPMWVADMDFKTAPCIIDNMSKLAKEGIFGYTTISDEWYEAVINWWKRRHNYSIQKDWLIFANGVVPSITSIIKRLTNVGDNIVVFTPVYNVFFDSIENNGRHTIDCELIYSNNTYKIDFDDLEKKLSDNSTTMLILCNPHNPIGKVWKKEELEKISILCNRYDIVVISDEIHCDIGMGNYIPFGLINSNCVMCMSAAKSFNLSGLQSSILCVPNTTLRNKVLRGVKVDHLTQPNSFAIESVICAFNKSEDWLDKLNEYISNNITFAKNYIETNLPFLKVVKQDATYLLWVDCSSIIDDTAILCDYIRKNFGLYIINGARYRGNGKYFVRINLATQFSRVEKGVELFFKGVKNYMIENQIVPKK